MVSAILCEVSAQIVDPMDGRQPRKVHVQNGVMPNIALKNKGPSTVAAMRTTKWMWEVEDCLREDDRAVPDN